MKKQRRIGMPRFLKSVAFQLYVGLGGAVLLTLTASVVAIGVFDQVGEAQGLVNEGSLPYMAAAIGVAQHVGALVHSAPRLTVAQSEEEFEQIQEELEGRRQDFEESLAQLAEGRGSGEGIRRVRLWGEEVTANIESIEDVVRERFQLRQTSSSLRERLQSMESELVELLHTAVDDQFFYTMTGHKTLVGSPDERETHFTEAELIRFRRVAELREGIAVGSQLLSAVFAVADPVLLPALQERYESAAALAARNLGALDTEASEGGLQIVSIVQDLYPLVFDQNGVFDVARRELEASIRLQELLDRNPEIAENLVSEIDVLVRLFNSGTLSAAQASTDIIRTGKNLLLALNVICIVAAIVVAWLFVGRHLLSRLRRLSKRMRHMAEGDLEAVVQVEGGDEIAEMASALEVFRRHAIEVQRLNLVEKLANDLQEKNDDLERVLGELRTAQNQIVLREKLAALGELTAGVAHEIRNPLNFIKNFSEVSEELLQELQEILEDEGESLDEETREEVEELCTDLLENLSLILKHGNRANRIVQDMLMMGRGSTERRSVDVNTLVEEHTALAYHSARAQDPDFNLQIDKDFGTEVGEITCVPQDVGRVVLNIVSNSCFATDEKRREGAVKGYLPSLDIKTRSSDDAVRIRIRDNGNGIPEEIKEKIFNPFFTTKDTDKGTGLGLALSSDIVREHGGQIRVRSKAGEYTEMVVELPRSGE